MIEIALYLFALANVAFGVFGLCFPRRAARFASFELRDTPGFGEIRGVYGGLVLTLGVALGWVAWSGSLDGAFVLLLAFAGLTAGRAISAVLDGPARYTLAALGLEALATALLWLAWSGAAGS